VPKSSIAIRTPASATRCSWTRALRSSISSDSVISRVSWAAGSPLSSRTATTVSAKQGSSSCRGATFTARRSPSAPGRLDQSAICRQALASTWLPRATMWPVRSASGMKVPGGQQAEVGVLPAGQRLGTGAAAGAQVDVRLVVEHDLAALDGVGQVLLQQPQLGDLPVAGLGEPLDPVLPLGLGRVHGDVGTAYEVPGGQLGCRPGQADAGADGGGDAAQPERLQQAPAEPVGDLVGVVGAVKAGAQQGELVAAEARRHPAAVPRPGQTAGHLDQQLVPGGVAVDVVDLLEVVEVDDQQGDGVLGGVGGGVEGGGQPLEEQRPVGEPGQLVVVGPVGQLGVDTAVGVGQGPLGGQGPERVEDVVGIGRTAPASRNRSASAVASPTARQRRRPPASRSIARCCN